MIKYLETWQDKYQPLPLLGVEEELSNNKNPNNNPAIQQILFHCFLENVGGPILTIIVASIPFFGNAVSTI